MNNSRFEIFGMRDVRFTRTCCCMDPAGVWKVNPRRKPTLFCGS